MSPNYYYQLYINPRKTSSRKSLPVSINSIGIPDVKILLERIAKNAGIQKNTPAPSIDFLNVLNTIIPDEYFGNKHNRKLFYKIVSKILTQSSSECIYLSCLSGKFNLGVIPWLQNNQTSSVSVLLQEVNFILLEKIVKPLIAHYYKPKRTFVRQELIFYSRQDLSSFEGLIFNQLRSMMYLVPADLEGEKGRGDFIIVPKGDLKKLEYRPLVLADGSTRDHKMFLRTLTGKIFFEVRQRRHISGGSLYQQWESFVKLCGMQKIYAVKMDVLDAFGNVDIEELCVLVTSCQLLKLEEKDFIVRHIRKQFVRINNKVYQWRHGLIQGDTLSSCLCELYMSYKDRTFLNDLTETIFLHRTVDDYFFCSVKPFEVSNFIQCLKKVHRINDSKTICNLPTSAVKEDVIPYSGYLFNLQTRQVKLLYKFTDNYSIRHAFKIWNFKYQIAEDHYLKFIQRAMSYSCFANSFTILTLNTEFNTRQTVFENVFDAMIYAAFKFDTVFTAIESDFLENDEIVVVLHEIIEKYSVKIFKKINNHKGSNYVMSIKSDNIKYLCYAAFIVVLKKRNDVYRDIIRELNNKMQSFKFYMSDVNFRYFKTLPSGFSNVKINRSVRSFGRTSDSNKENM